jgi:hypothetical protein
LPRRVVERRVHQNAHDRIRQQAGSREIVWRCRDIQIGDIDTCMQTIELCILARKRREARVHFDQSDADILDAGGEREPRCANPRAKIDGALACMARARGGKQNGIMADAMSPPELP